VALAFTNDTDIEAMFADSPHTITAGAVTEPCWFDEAQEVVLDDALSGGQITYSPAAIVQTSKFPDVAKGDQVSISDGTEARTFEVWRARRLDDGALKELLLREIEEEES
jgi:hypothetical protein